jgi:hypothetical protein
MSIAICLLVKSDRIVGQAQIPENKKASEKTTEWNHLQEWQSNGHEKPEWSPSCKPKHKGSACEMPHRICYLHILELSITENPVKN